MDKINTKLLQSYIEGLRVEWNKIYLPEEEPSPNVYYHLARSDAGWSLDDYLYPRPGNGDLPVGLWLTHKPGEWRVNRFVGVDSPDRKIYTVRLKANTELIRFGLGRLSSQPPLWPVPGFHGTHFIHTDPPKYGTPWWFASIPITSVCIWDLNQIFSIEPFEPR